MRIGLQVARIDPARRREVGRRLLERHQRGTRGRVVAERLARAALPLQGQAQLELGDGQVLNRVRLERGVHDVVLRRRRVEEGQRGLEVVLGSTRVHRRAGGSRPAAGGRDRRLGAPPPRRTPRPARPRDPRRRAGSPGRTRRRPGRAAPLEHLERRAERAQERVDRAAETEGGEAVRGGWGCGQRDGGSASRPARSTPHPDVTPALRRRELRAALGQEAEVADEAAAVGADAGVHHEHLGHDPLEVVAVEVARGRRPEAQPPRWGQRELGLDRLRGRLVVAGGGQHVGERHPGDDVHGARRRLCGRAPGPRPPPPPGPAPRPPVTPAAGRPPATTRRRRTRAPRAATRGPGTARRRHQPPGRPSAPPGPRARRSPMGSPEPRLHVEPRGPRLAPDAARLHARRGEPLDH